MTPSSRGNLIAVDVGTDTAQALISTQIINFAGRTKLNRYGALRVRLHPQLPHAHLPDADGPPVGHEAGSGMGAVGGILRIALLLNL